MNINIPRWLCVTFLPTAFIFVLGFYCLESAAQQPAQPFANAVDQRNEMIRELREIKELLKEQNQLLKAGKENAGKKP
jgi:hypothetical protein